MERDEIVLTTRLPAIGRLLLAVAGLALLVFPLRDLHPWDLPLLPFGLPFWIVGLGGASIGAILLTGAVVGEASVTRITPGALQVARRSLLGRRTDRLTPADITAIEVVEHAWESRPDSYSVRIAFRRGQPVSTREYPDRAAAEAEAGRIRALLTRA